MSRQLKPELVEQKFGRVRFIVPAYAKSAATMMAMSGNEIVMDEDAELGPIDPQMFTRNGVVPGEAIKDAIRCARGNNGGEWATHYNEDQKEFWRKFVRDLAVDLGIAITQG